MIETAQLAGFFAAHAVWSVSDGEALIPLIGYEHPDGSRGMDRFLHEDIADGAHAALESLQDNSNGYARAAVAIDAFLHVAGGKVDALIVEAHQYGLTPGRLKVAVPYRPRTETSTFAVYRAKVLESMDDQDTLMNAFFDGVDAHEDAAPVWHNAYEDVSV
ncbi:hypothetical protein [Saccharothrix obliqua]|uniref:hypothetical protein n=1 Tax=Saccharothrix obliqua TaxID=2861747 RepID=UPI001C607045|nr:hypothetical protein [Saccharothrix obliqua]MBW4716795.1 hypothetical protein [Saccharothrix obliqua]